MSIFSFKRPASEKRVAAMIPHPDGLAIALSEHSSTGVATLLDCEYVPWETNTEAKVLREKLRQFGLLKKRLSTSLLLGDYTLLSVTAPEVPATELKAAIRWQIKDLIDFHIDDAVLDVFDAPAAGINGQQHNLYVVVTRKSVIEEHIKPFLEVDSNLTNIDIPELALRNISTRTPEDEAGVVFVYLNQEQGLIIITRQKTLYLARSLDVGYGVMNSPAAMESQVDRLGLEIQRSMDYYDRYFMQPPISGLVIAPMPVKVPGMTERLSENLGIDARILNINSIIESNSTLEDSLQSDCLIAIAASLREEKMSL